MSQRNVLIAYRSRHRYVAQIARDIGKILDQEGIKTQLLDIRKTRTKKWPSMDEFDGFLFGTWVHVWEGVKRKYRDLLYQPKSFPNVTKKFLRINELALNSEEKPFAIFVSDPFLLGNIIDPEGTDEHLERAVNQQLPVKADIYKTFGPVIDLSYSSHLKREDRDRLRKMVKEVSKVTGLDFNYKGLNDFRDADEIFNFTMDFAALLNKDSLKKEKEYRFCSLCGNKIENPEAKFCISCGGKIED
jgi:menaquinone-dependent protoporphyrinogen IX oxidase